MLRHLAVACFASAVSALAAEPALLPWQEWVDVPTESTSLESVLDLPWNPSGGPEGRLVPTPDTPPNDGRCLRFEVVIDHHNAGAYPQGWPSFETKPQPSLDFRGWDALRYWIRGDTALTRTLPLRFILWTNGALRINTLLPPFRAGTWVQVTHRLTDVPFLDKVDRLHFFLCESDYAHNDGLAFEVGGFELVKLKRELSVLLPAQAAAGLWLGARADRGDQAVILDETTASVPALLVVETGKTASVANDARLRVRFHNVFTGHDDRQELPLGQNLPPGAVTRLQMQFPTAGLAPGYYLTTADLVAGGRSVLDARVGCDDLYIRRGDESMAFTVLSLRTGMVLWARDLLNGDIMCRTRIALPHTYDPLDRTTYPQFVRLFAHTTGKHTEGNEAGVTGLALAAEAFRKSGDPERCRFTEGLLEDACNHMLARMQAPCGAAIVWVNELADQGVGKGAPSNAPGSYDSNQTGEWMRALVYAMLYFQNHGQRPDYARTLSAACRRAADYLVAHALQDSDGVPGVLRHLQLSEQPDGTVRQVTYHQEGRQCDVYLGRALSGLAYYAYAMQVLGEPVPAAWWPVLDNTVRWSAAHMQANGWFDWQCGDLVEGGCHTFLGNIYIGEGLFGCYLADHRAGRTAAAATAAEATRRAYRYVTDDCVIRGKKFEYPVEFWVGPYVYWLFTEYLDQVGPDERLAAWRQELDRRWSVERQWHDFLDRAPTGGCGRTSTNGMLEVSILGYLGLKQMAAVGKPLHW